MAEPGSMERQSRSGFTLIELMAVVVIIGLITTVALLNLEHLVPSYRLDSAAREVATMIRRARHRAIHSGVAQKLIYNVERGAIRIVSAENYHAKSESSFEEETVDSEGSRYFLPEYAAFESISVRHTNHDARESKNEVLIIGPHGTIPYHSVVVSGGEDRHLTVVPNPVTGHVQILDGVRENREPIRDDRPLVRTESSEPSRSSEEHDQR